MKRLQLVPLLGTVIEQNGDGLLEDSLMPVGWPLHLDGAVKQRCVHQPPTASTVQILVAIGNPYITAWVLGRQLCS